MSVTSFLSTAVHPPVRTSSATPGLVHRVHEQRAEARGRRELQLGLSGDYGPAMQAALAAMQVRSR